MEFAMTHPWKRHPAFRLIMLRKMRPAMGGESTLRALLHGVGVHAVGKIVNLLLHPFERREEDRVDHARARHGYSETLYVVSDH